MKRHSKENQRAAHLRAACGEGAHSKKARPQVMRALLCSSPAHKGEVDQAHINSQRQDSSLRHPKASQSGDKSWQAGNLQREFAGHPLKMLAVVLQAAQPGHARQLQRLPVRTSCPCAASHHSSPLCPPSSWRYGSTAGRESAACSSSVSRAHLPWKATNIGTCGLLNQN
jgi:hypothetical protein